MAPLTDTKPGSTLPIVGARERAARFCRRFGLRVPILQAPMAGAFPTSLASAVANAGGMGVIDTHLSRLRSRVFRPKAPFHAGRRRCRHSTTPVEAELWITDQYFGAANKRDSAIDARGYRVGSGKLRGDIISHAVFRVVKPAAGPMARTVGLQTPNDGETAKVPLP